MTLDWLTYFPSPVRGVWHLGPVPIRAYALCIIIGIVMALLLGDRRWRARGGEPGVIYDVALWAVPFGLIGGRLYHLMTDWRTYFGEGGVGWEATPRIWDGGLGIWGAVALGGVGAWIGCRRRGIPLPAFGDAVAPGVVLAQAIGRIGNYFNQELYGRETTLPWGLEIFWREDAAGMRDPHLLDGVSTGELYKIVQPTFLYELLWNLVVFAVLIYADRRFRMGHGRLFALYVAGYCIGRFGIELLRDDAATHIAGIRVNSFTATFVFIGAVVYILLATKGREDPEAIRRSWQTDEPGEPGEPDNASTEPEPQAEAEVHAGPDEPPVESDTAADSDVEDEIGADEAADDTRGALSEVVAAGTVDHDVDEAEADEEADVEAEAEAGDADEVSAEAGEQAGPPSDSAAETVAADSTDPEVPDANDADVSDVEASDAEADDAVDAVDADGDAGDVAEAADDAEAVDVVDSEDAAELESDAEVSGTPATEADDSGNAEQP